MAVTRCNAAGRFYRGCMKWYICSPLLLKHRKVQQRVQQWTVLPLKLEHVERLRLRDAVLPSISSHPRSCAEGFYPIPGPSSYLAGIIAQHKSCELSSGGRMIIAVLTSAQGNGLQRMTSHSGDATPTQLQEKEATQAPIVVAFDGPDDPLNPQNWPVRHMSSGVEIGTK
jgi:hypothetical protein